MMKEAEREKLAGAYEIAFLDFDTLFPLFEAHRTAVFGKTFYLNFHEFALGDAELSAMRRLSENMEALYRANFAVYHGDEFVGWSFGVQRSREKYQMINTGILPEHQGKGIYKALLPKVLEHVLKEGFQIIYSRHSATNNRVIVPKLKAGFVISGMELSDTSGTLVHLSYFVNAIRQQAMDMLSGQELPTGKLRDHITNLVR